MSKNPSSGGRRLSAGKVESLLGDANLRFRAIFDHTFEFIGLLDPEGAILEANQAALDYAGTTGEAVIGCKTWETHWFSHSPETQRRVREAIARARGGEFVREDFSHPDLSGELRTFDFSLSPVLTESGAVAFLIAEGRDIEERRQRETEQQLQFLELVQNSPNFICLASPDGRIAFVNRAGQALAGLPPNWDEQALTIPGLFIDGDFDDTALEILRAVQQGEPWAGECGLRNLESGASVPLMVHLFRIYNRKGGVVQLAIMGQDLREHRRAAEEREQLLLREQAARAEARAEYRFRELLEAAPDAILEVGADGKILLVNATAEKMFLYSRDELIGQEVEVLVPGTLRGNHHGYRKAYAAQPATRPMGVGLELQAQRKDGSLFPVEISLSPLSAGRGAHVMAIVRDVSERKRAEERIRSLQERFTHELEEKNRQLEQRNTEIERANRLKSEFLATMSHELRSPLHTVIGFAELLAEELEGPLNDKQKRFVNNIHQDSQHLLAIINDILDISKIEAGRLEFRIEHFPLDEAVEEVLTSIRPQAGAKNLHLETALGASLALEADRLRFKQILLNLLSNAVKFTPPGGRISVSAIRRRGKVAMTVADTGVGIPREDQRAIFDKFYQVGSTTKGVREGTGLGLAITRKLVEQQGGQIWVDSEPGRGSRFTFTLREPPHTAAKPLPLVLIMEDEPQAAELLVNYLEPAGYATAEASTKQECITRAMELQPDAIILDLLAPSSECWSALRELKHHPETADIPVIIVSVTEEDNKSSNLGAAVHLTKPVSKKMLLESLRRAVGGNGGRSPEILAVDDEPSALQLLHHLLTEAGYRPKPASSGPEALRLLAGGFRPAAIIVDLMMPEMSGFDLIFHLKSEAATASIPVIVLTGMELNDEDVETLRGATNAILLKGSSWRGRLLGELRKLAS